jgi:glutathione S-transferase
MKLYYAPGACSFGIHVLLEEIGKPYQIEAVNFREGAQYKPPYTGINPKSKVPTLERDDGSILTEFPVIARWLALQNPQANLIPKDPETDLRAMEVMEYVVGTLHQQGFTRLFRTDRFAPSASDHEAVKAQGRENIEKGFAIVDKALGDKDYLGGKDLSVADAALFYVEYWGAKRVGMQLPKNCAAHFERMMARPAVQRALQQEGMN